MPAASELFHLYVSQSVSQSVCLRVPQTASDDAGQLTALWRLVRSGSIRDPAERAKYVFPNIYSKVRLHLCVCVCACVNSPLIPYSVYISARLYCVIVNGCSATWNRKCHQALPSST